MPTNLAAIASTLGGSDAGQCDCACAENMDEPAILSAWLHLTDRCNLRCAYCYLPHAPLDMTVETGRAAIAATFRSALAHGYPAIKLKYSGGEPLLCTPLLFNLQHYAQELAETYHLALTGVVLSNGTLLTPELVTRLREANLRLMLSLDGIGSSHDRQRYRLDGHGSSAAAVQAVEMACAGGVTPEISITISGRNLAQLPHTLAWVLERELPFSLNFYREPGSVSVSPDLRPMDDCLVQGVLAAYQVIAAHLPPRSLASALVDRANLAALHLHPCNAGHSYLVFDPLGRVALCQMAIAQTVTDCHAPDPLAVVRANKTGFQNLPVDRKETCSQCQWRYLCAGGCPLYTYQQKGRYDLPSPYCVVYQALLPAALHLEQLRQQQYSSAEL